MELNILKLFITKTYKLLGQPLPEDFNDFASEVHSFVPRNFTADDIEKCFRMGRHGKLDDDKYLNERTFFVWIEEYRKKYFQPPFDPKMQLTESTKPTDEEIKQIMIEGVKECFLQYKRGKIDYFDRTAGGVYDFLLKNGIGAIDEVEMSAIIEKARLTVIATTKKKQWVATANDVLSDINYCKNIVKSIMNNLPNNDADSLIRIQVKRICLRKIFDKIIEIDGDISDYLNFE